MAIIGVMLVLVAGFIASYLVGLDVKDSWSLPIPYEFVVISVILSVVIVIFSFIQRIKIAKTLKELEVLNSELEKFVKERSFNLETKNKDLFHIFSILNDTFNNLIKEQELQEVKTQKIEKEIKQLKNIIDLENSLVCEVTETGKVVKANKRFLKTFDFESETKLNMKVKHIFDLFNENIDKIFNNNIGKDIIVTLADRKFNMYIEKIPKELAYVITFVEITKFEEEKVNIIKKIEYAGKDIKSSFVMNKLLETTMIKILNYNNYLANLGKGILEAFEEKFADKIKSLGYDEVFKVQDNLFAIYAKDVNFEKITKALEETIIVSVGNDKYIITPKVVLSSGVNFEQAYQQIAESSKTFISKSRQSAKYDLEFIKLINKTILENRLYLGYSPIEKEENTIVLYPIVKDEYGTVLSQNEVNVFLREFNLYLYSIKQIILNNINLLKHSKLIINVNSEDLLTTTMLVDLLSLIKREDLMVVFNVNINSKYAIIRPLLKQIKSYAQLGFRNIGSGYLNYIDIYSLKVEYLELDEKLANLVINDNKWKFLVDSVKLLVQEQKTKVLSTLYNDEKVQKISKNIKIYEN